MFYTTKFEIGIKVHLKMTGYNNDTENDATLGIQKKPINVLIIKRNIPNEKVRE